MRQIYEGARKTRIWLGPSDDKTGKAFSLMHKLVSAHSLQTASNDTRSYFEMGVQGQTKYGLPNILDSSFKAFSALLEREWFTRVWIIQEVAVSKEAAMWCGGFYISWQDFLTAVYYATSTNIPGILSNTTHTQRIVQLEVARRSKSEEYKQSLLTLLMLYRSFNATDPRDKIYSLLGIPHEVEPDAVEIVPNYTIAAREVYQRFTVSTLEQGKSLDILGVPRVSKASQVGELPSWVADWSVSDFALNFRFRLHPEQHFLRSEATQSSVSFNPRFLEDHSILGLDGHVVDDIEEVGEVHSHQVEGELTWLQRIGRIAGEQSVLNGWEKICKARSGSKYPRTGEDILDVYWQTLCAGQKPNGFEATKLEYLAWDRCVRKPSRFVPTSDLLKFTHSILSIPVVLAVGAAATTSGIPITEIMSFRSKMTVATQRRMIRTKDGLVGLAPELVRKGDFVCLFKGGMVPLVMREVGSRWVLIGDSYIHGIMHGEAFEETKCKTMWIQ